MWRQVGTVSAPEMITRTLLLLLVCYTLVSDLLFPFLELFQAPLRVHNVIGRFGRF